MLWSLCRNKYRTGYSFFRELFDPPTPWTWTDFNVVGTAPVVHILWKNSGVQGGILKQSMFQCFGAVIGEINYSTGCLFSSIQLLGHCHVVHIWNKTLWVQSWQYKNNRKKGGHNFINWGLVAMLWFLGGCRFAITIIDSPCV